MLRFTTLFCVVTTAFALTQNQCERCIDRIAESEWAPYLVNTQNAKNGCDTSTFCGQNAVACRLGKRIRSDNSFVLNGDTITCTAPGNIVQLNHITDSPTPAPPTPQTASPSGSPTPKPVSDAPSSSPTTLLPTSHPSASPSRGPTTVSPTPGPSSSPSKAPTSRSPTGKPTTLGPTQAPTTKSPVPAPSPNPSQSPTPSPSRQPTGAGETLAPTATSDVNAGTAPTLGTVSPTTPTPRPTTSAEGSANKENDDAVTTEGFMLLGLGAVGGLLIIAVVVLVLVRGSNTRRQRREREMQRGRRKLKLQRDGLIPSGAAAGYNQHAPMRPGGETMMNSNSNYDDFEEQGYDEYRNAPPNTGFSSFQNEMATRPPPPPQTKESITSAAFDLDDFTVRHRDILDDDF